MDLVAFIKRTVEVDWEDNKAVVEETKIWRLLRFGIMLWNQGDAQIEDDEPKVNEDLEQQQYRFLRERGVGILIRHCDRVDLADHLRTLNLHSIDEKQEEDEEKGIFQTATEAINDTFRWLGEMGIRWSVIERFKKEKGLKGDDLRGKLRRLHIERAKKDSAKKPSSSHF